MSRSNPLWPSASTSDEDDAASDRPRPAAGARQTRQRASGSRGSRSSSARSVNPAAPSSAVRLEPAQPGRPRVRPPPPATTRRRPVRRRPWTGARPRRRTRAIEAVRGWSWPSRSRTRSEVRVKSASAAVAAARSCAASATSRPRSILLSRGRGILDERRDLRHPERRDPGRSPTRPVCAPRISPIIDLHAGGVARERHHVRARGGQRLLLPEDEEPGGRLRRDGQHHERDPDDAVLHGATVADDTIRASLQRQELSRSAGVRLAVLPLRCSYVRRSRRPCELHRRLVLEHRVPLPAFGRIRRLQRRPHDDRPREGDAGEVRRSPAGRPCWPRCPRAPAPSSRRRAPTPSVTATLTRICQSSIASPGGATTCAGRLHDPLVVRVAGVLLEVGGAGQDEIGRAREVGHQDALDRQHLDRRRRAAPRSATTRRPATRPDPGRGRTRPDTAPLSTACRSADRSAEPSSGRRRRSPGRGRPRGSARRCAAPRTSFPPAAACRSSRQPTATCCSAPSPWRPRAIWPSDHQLLERRVRGRQQPHARAPPRSLDRAERLAQLHQQVVPAGRLQHAGGVAHHRRCGAGRPPRRSGSRSGRCRTSSTRSRRG